MGILDTLRALLTPAEFESACIELRAEPSPPPSGALVFAQPPVPAPVFEEKPPKPSAGALALTPKERVAAAMRTGNPAVVHAVRRELGL